MQQSSEAKPAAMPNGYCGNPWSELRQRLSVQLLVGDLDNMTVSWRMRLAGVSGPAGGKFDDDCAVDRRDWPAVGWSRDGRSWYPAGSQLWQYPGPYRRG